MGIMDCIYRIPFCGGWCYPTENPDPSCLRHASNESTLPLADKYLLVLDYVEQSACCISCGRLGPPCADVNRKKIQLFALAVNFVGFLCACWSFMGVIQQKSVLQNFYWVSGSFESMPELSVYTGVEMHLSVLNCDAAVSRDNCLQYANNHNYTATNRDCCPDEYVLQVPFADAHLCTLDDELDEMCHHCQDARFAPLTLFMGVFSTLPTMATNLQRATRFGDVNCQKTMGVLSNLFGLCTSIYALSAFHTYCVRSLPDDVMGLNVDWQVGLGYWMLIISIFCKIPDAVCHIIIPTPRERWSTPERELESTADYMYVESIYGPEGEYSEQEEEEEYSDDEAETLYPKNQARTLQNA